MVNADGAAALASAGVAVLFAMGSPSVPAVLAALLARAVAGRSTARMQATTTLMVPPRSRVHRGRANQALDGTSIVISAPLGALLDRRSRCGEC